MWMSVIGDFHDSICHCCQPFAHLLDIIFPEGHKDKDKTVRQIIDRDLQQCLSGGDEERDFGMANEGTSAEGGGPADAANKEEEDIELTALIAAAEEAEKR